eukprot:351317-Chlamydomonas_euryale.AAC.4
MPDSPIPSREAGHAPGSTTSTSASASASGAGRSRTHGAAAVRQPAHPLWPSMGDPVRNAVSATPWQPCEIQHTRCGLA